jgi:hypothetical protein
MPLSSNDWSRSIDYCINSLVIFPAAVFNWRGTWDVLGVYIFPEQTPLNHWVTTAIGCSSLFWGYFICPPLGNWLRGCRHGVFLVGSRLAMYVYSVLYVFLWRGVWSLLDHYMTSDWRWSLIGYLGGCLVTMALRSFRTAMWAPLSACLDKKQAVLIPAPRFGTKVHHHYHHHHHHYYYYYYYLPRSGRNIVFNPFLESAGSSAVWPIESRFFLKPGHGF